MQWGEGYGTAGRVSDARGRGPYSRTVYRAAVAAMFFLQGLSFASWASRIPSIQERLGLSESALGGVLLALPVGSMVSLPLSGWLVARRGSAAVVVGALSLYGVALVGLGVAGSVPQLLGVLFFFGLLGNAVNISVNTQAVGVEALYGRSVMAAFHGMWSLAGFVAAAVGALLLGWGVVPVWHFAGTLGVMGVGVAVCSRFTLQEARVEAGGRVLAVPDRALMGLGVMAFCSMSAEGAMFDWSGVYFRQVVGAEGAWVGAGYAVFMAAMASGRFLADGLVHRLGLQRVFQLSGGLIALGLGVSVAVPLLPVALGGFLLVGFGVSSVVPLVYGAAGKSQTMPAGVALAAVSTIGFLGFLMGPPVIGLVAGATSLRVSFALIACLGFGVAWLASSRKW